jgi:hypothetical protein
MALKKLMAANCKMYKTPHEAHLRAFLPMVLWTRSREGWPTLIESRPEWPISSD